MSTQKQPNIIIQNQNVQSNNGCFTGCFQWILGLLAFGILLTIIQAFAPFIGIIIGLVIGSWIGYCIESGNETETFKNVLLKLRYTNWRDFKNVEKSIKIKLYFIVGFAIPLAIIGYLGGRNLSEYLSESFQ